VEEVTMMLGSLVSHSYRLLHLAVLGAAIAASGCAVANGDRGDLSPGISSDDSGSTTDAGNFDVSPGLDAPLDGVEGDGSTACVATAVTAEQVPLDMLILLDASSSMLDPTITPQKWSTVVDALTAFFGDPASKGISVALTIFPVTGAGSCSAATYQTPQIDYGILPGSSAALVKAMKDTDPSVRDITPLHSVAQGALAGAVDWKSKHTGHTVVAVIATDGKSTCVTSVEPTTSAANALTKGVQTYTIGMNGADLTQLNAIAVAGGTKKAYDATDISVFSKQMSDIRATALPCEVVIPPAPAGETFDRDKVNVDYTPGAGGSAETIPYVKTAAGCGTGAGWYYDDDTSPTKVMYCPSTCKTIQGDTKAKVDVAFGCKTIIR
jgi:hypothetical protein